MPTDLKHDAADGSATWEADQYGYNGGYGGKPKEHHVNAQIGHAASYYGCSHELELTRTDLLALLALLDEAERRSDAE